MLSNNYLAMVNGRRLENHVGSIHQYAITGLACSNCAALCANRVMSADFSEGGIWVAMVVEESDMRMSL